MSEYTLEHDGVEMIAYPPELQHGVELAAAKWREFCNLPLDIKNQFAASDTQSGIGYETKDGTGPHGDHKENFDFSSSGAERLVSLAEGITHTIPGEFVGAMLSLDDLVQPMVIQFKRDASIESQTTTFFRFLHYPSGQKAGELIAESHTDHSGFTFHLLETTEGCERLTRDGDWASLPVASGQAAAFGGMQTQLASGGNIKALCHRVVANETSSTEGRLAIVCFVALTDIARYDKQTHGRLQEMEPGFNYDQTFDEFKRLFVS